MSVATVDLSRPQITSFIGEYEYLDNSYPVAIIHLQTTFPSVTHAFEASKTQNSSEHSIMRGVGLAGLEEAGKAITPQRHWDMLRIPVMHSLLRQKFGFDNYGLMKKLINTGESQIWVYNGDPFWGIDIVGEGRNMLGQMMEDVRRQLRAEDIEFGSKARFS